MRAGDLSTRDDRIDSISRESWELLGRAFDDDRLTITQAREYMVLNEFVEQYDELGS